MSSIFEEFFGGLMSVNVDAKTEKMKIGFGINPDDGIHLALKPNDERLQCGNVCLIDDEEVNND